MPTVIPYQDATGELFNAFRTMQDIKQSAQKIAIDQALADQHIQSAQIVDQLNKSRGQIEQQQATEFTSSRGISNRAQAQDTALAQGQANLEGANLQNQQMVDENPLHLASLHQNLRLGRIRADSAQQELNALQEKIDSQKDLNKLTIQALKFKNQSEGMMDPHTADLNAQLSAAQAKGQLESLPAQLKARNAQLENTVTQLEDLHKTSVIQQQQHMAAIAGQVGVPAAKAIAAQMPGFEGWKDVPDDAMKANSDPKKQELAQMVALYQSPNTPVDVKSSIIENMGRNIAINTAGWKEPTEMQKMIGTDEKTGKVFKDTVFDNARKIAEHILKNSKLNQRTGEATPPGMLSVEDQRNEVTSRVSQSQSQGIGAIAESVNQGQPAAPPQAAQPSVQVKQTQTTNPDVTTQFDSAKSLKELDRTEQIIKKSKNSAMTYVSNKAPGAGDPRETDTSEADSLIMNASDPKFTINSDGMVYDRTLKSKNKEIDPRILGESSIKDETFRDRIQSKISLGLKDAVASSAQTARFSYAMSQLAKAYSEQQSPGLQGMYNVIRQKYAVPGPNGMTKEQLQLINSLMADYGLYK